MPSVTVPGPDGSTITTTYNNPVGNSVAQQIANALAMASQTGSLSITSVSGSTTPPPPTPGVVNELVLGSVTGGQITIPSGPAGTTGYVVVVDSAQPETITGGPNTTILGGSGTVTIIDPATITLSDVSPLLPGGNDVVVLTTGDTGATVTGNSGNDTISAAGVDQSIYAGAGNNMLSASGAGDIIVGGAGSSTITLTGTGDTVFGGTGTGSISGASTNMVFANLGGSSTINAGAGTPTVFGSFGAAVGSDVIIGGSGALLVATGESNDTIFAGTAANQSIFGGYSLSGNGSNVIFGGSQDLEIATGASNDTITAGSGTDSVYIGNGTTAGSQLILGGTGGLRVQFVGGAGSATIIGGSGAATVFGTGDSNVKWVGGQTGGIVDAVGNVTSSGSYDASASTSNDTLIGASGNVSIAGGSGNDFILGGVNTGSLGSAGTVVGGTTMTGGTGNNVFLFTSGLVNGGDVIQNFTSNDFLALSGYGSAAGATALANAITAGSTTTLKLSDGTSISFLNTSVAQLMGHISST